MQLKSPAQAMPREQGQRQAHPRQPERPAQGQGAFLEVIERVEQVVEAETAALKQFKAVDLQEFNARKSQGLLEMSRAVRGLGGTSLDPETSSRLKMLRAKLEINQALLSTHLRAAREITSVVAETIRDSESDGTYSNMAYMGAASPW
jgi:hypothetical protein